MRDKSSSIFSLCIMKIANFRRHTAYFLLVSCFCIAFLQILKSWFHFSYIKSSKSLSLADLEKIQILPLIKERNDSESTWCRDIMTKYRIIPNRDWGELKSGDIRKEWDIQNCNSILKYGRVLGCEELHGKTFIDIWKSKYFGVCPSEHNSAICRNSIFDQLQCSYYGLIIDKGYINQSVTNLTFNANYIIRIHIK